MEKQREERINHPAGASAGTAAGQESARNNEENELQAEQESAAAMDSDVPQPPAASETTEGQPS